MDQCKDCVFFIDGGEHNTLGKCVLHGLSDVINKNGWCRHFLRGRQGLFGPYPEGLLTKKESGYVDDAKASMKGHDWRKREG